MQPERRIRQPRCLQHAPPEQAHGAELGERGEDVLVCRKRDADRADEVNVIQRFKFAQRGDGRRQRGAKFLRVGCALFMPAAAIGLHVGAGIAASRQFRRIGSRGEGEGDIEPLGVDRFPGDEFGKRQGCTALDAQRHGVKVHALQHPREAGRINAIATRGSGSLRDQHEAGSAIGKVVECQFIGAPGVRVVDTLEQRPRHLRGPRRAGGGELAIDRLQPDAIRRGADQLLLETGTLQHRLDALHPFGPAYGRKFRGQLQITHGRFSPPSLLQLRNSSEDRVPPQTALGLIGRCQT